MNTILHFVLITSMFYSQSGFAVRADVKKNMEKLAAHKQYLQSIEGQIVRAQSRNDVIEILDGAVQKSFAKIKKRLPLLSERKAERLMARIENDFNKELGEQAEVVFHLLSIEESNSAKENLAAISSNETRLAIRDAIEKELPPNIERIKEMARDGLFARAPSKKNFKIDRRPALFCDLKVSKGMFYAAAFSIEYIPVLGMIPALMFYFAAFPAWLIFDFPRGCELDTLGI